MEHDDERGIEGNMKQYTLPQEWWSGGYGCLCNKARKTTKNEGSQALVLS